MAPISLVRGMLESALARPRQLLSCGNDVDMPRLAAAYAAGMAHNHPFVAGNKRSAYVVCRTFLVLNAWNTVGELSERYPIFLGVAEGSLDEEQLTAWLREHYRPDQVSESSGSYQTT